VVWGPVPDPHLPALFDNHRLRETRHKVRTRPDKRQPKVDDFFVSASVEREVTSAKRASFTANCYYLLTEPLGADDGEPGPLARFHPSRSLLLFDCVGGTEPAPPLSSALHASFVSPGRSESQRSGFMAAGHSDTRPAVPVLITGRASIVSGLFYGHFLLLCSAMIIGAIRQPFTGPPATPTVGPFTKMIAPEAQPKPKEFRF
jgi:hypothetical protein